MSARVRPAPAVAPPDADDPMRLSARALAAAFSAGRLTAAEVLAASLARIDAVDGTLGAFLALDRSGAEAAAAAADRRRASGHVLGPLDGVPVAVKDNVDVAGLPTTGGHARFRDRVTGADAPLVARLRAAGAVVVGKTNLDEGALGATTANPHFGATVNPLAAGHTPGGSSGGSAAAVAGHLVPLAIGTDTMGSVRIPAAYCGVFGLMPTTGLLARTGIMPLSWLLDTPGVIARTAGDLAEAIHVLRGFDVADEASVAAPAGWSAFADVRQDLAGVVVGLPPERVLSGLSEPVAEAFARTVSAVATLGGETVEVSLEGWRPDMDRRAGLLMAEAEASAALENALAAGRGGFGEAFLALLDYGRRAPVPKLARACRSVRRVGATVRRALADVDVLMTPTTPQLAFPHDAPIPDDQADFTALANFAGLPAISFPVATKILPAGVQLVGPSFSEARLVALADALARAPALAQA